jgi:hypothetical protein
MPTWTLAGPLVAAGLGLSVGLAATAGISRAQQHRQADAHEHGRGTLNIAIEGKRITMELEAPGADIVGFEHAVKTGKQKAAVELARKQLAAPQKLFKLPAAAGCVLTEAKVELEGYDDDHGAKAPEHTDDHKDDHRHGHKSGHKDGKSDDAKAGHGDEHAGFKAEYAFDCKAPASLTSVVFDYFKAFVGAEKLDVTVITSKGQSKLEVSRVKPRIDFGGMM